MTPVVESRTHPPSARGLRRERLDLLLRRITDHRLTLLVAPAGSGKTTALAQFAESSAAPVAWYCADTVDGRDEVFLAYLQAAIAGVADLGDTGPWTTADDVVHTLDRLGPDRLVIVVDDLHTIAGRPAEALLGRIVAQAPPHVSLAFGSRSAPTFDTSRWQLADDVMLLSADDLRFRTWEAEDLLERTYALPLGPEDVARLTRRVEGWAAGFQLFHLAVRDKPPPEQRRLIDTASSRSALARQYLTQNVLAGLPADLRDFLVHTSLLGVVTGELADEFLERQGSIDDLRRLEELELFVSRLDDRTYRYHEVLRSHLEAELMGALTAPELDTRFTIAGTLLDRAGYSGEAIRCYARAGRWGDVSRLAGEACSETFGTSPAWLDLLGDPQAGLDPWVSLAQARAELTNGRFSRASEHYQRAEELFGDADPGAVCRRERIEMESFLDPLASAPGGWLGDLHAGLRHDPIGAAHRLAQRGTPEGSVASGVLLLVVGQLEAAAARFDDALVHDAQPDWAIQAGRLGRQLVRLLLGAGDVATTVATINHLIGGVESAWLGRFARAVVAIASGGVEDAARIARECETGGDPWGAAFAHLCAGVAALDDHGLARRHYSSALAIASRHHTAVLEAAAHGGLATVTDGQATDRHTEAEHRLVRRMSAATRPIERLLRLRAAIAPALAGQPVRHDAVPPTEQAPQITVRCLGDFALGPPDDPVDLRGLRPRARTVLQRLALDIGRGVHRDQLLEDLWADADEASAVRSLQVAVSAIRRLLDDADAPVTVERVDERYVLTEPSQGICDLTELRRLQREVDDGRSADVAGIGRRALAVYGGDLLPGAGTADWVVVDRDHARIGAARIARAGASAALEAGDAEDAVALAERGLQIDPFDDTLWRLAIDAHERRGDACAAERLRRGYDAMLSELGVDRTGS